MSVMTVNSIVHVFWESECIILSFSKEPKELPRVAEKTCKVWFLVHCIAIIYMDLMSLLLCAWALLSCRFLCPGDAYIYSFLFHFSNWRWDFARRTVLLLRLYLLKEFCFLDRHCYYLEWTLVVVYWPQGALLHKSCDQT